MSIEAMKQALEALNKNVGELRIAGARHILRTAIEAAEKQEPADWLIRGYVDALVANRPDEAADATKRMVDYVFTSPPAAPVQEPVVCKHKFVMDDEAPSHACCQLCGEVRTASTPPTPPTLPAAQRQWVGLTDEQIHQYDYQYRDILYDVEKMLRDNNT